MIASAALGLLTLAGLLRGWARALRPLAIGAFVAIVGGWAVAQYPYLLPETLTVDAGAGAGSALTAMIIVFIAALVIVGPSLALLFRWRSVRPWIEPRPTRALPLRGRAAATLRA